MTYDEFTEIGYAVGCLRGAMERKSAEGCHGDIEEAIDTLVGLTDKFMAERVDEPHEPTEDIPY